MNAMILIAVAFLSFSVGGLIGYTQGRDHGMGATPAQRGAWYHEHGYPSGSIINGFEIPYLTPEGRAARAIADAYSDRVDRKNALRQEQP